MNRASVGGLLQPERITGETSAAAMTARKVSAMEAEIAQPRR